MRRRSHHLFVAAVFLLLSIFGVENVFSLGVGINREQQWQGKNLPKGCHTFIGKVQCHYANKPILPTATVILWEWDKLLDPNDEVSSAKVNPDGTYKIEGCAEDTFLGIRLDNIQLFLRFYDVCEPGDHYDNKFPYPNVDQTWKLSMYQAHWVQDNPSPQPINSVNHGRKFKKMRKSNGRKLADYPPMPRPYSHRISNGHNLGYMNGTSADDGGFKSNSSMPEFGRPNYSPRPRLPGVTYDYNRGWLNETNDARFDSNTSMPKYRSYVTYSPRPRPQEVTYGYRNWLNETNDARFDSNSSMPEFGRPNYSSRPRLPGVTYDYNRDWMNGTFRDDDLNTSMPKYRPYVTHSPRPRPNDIYDWMNGTSANAFSNNSLPKFYQPRRSKYPPMPRPHQYEMADNDDDFESNEYIPQLNPFMSKQEHIGASLRESPEIF